MITVLKYAFNDGEIVSSALHKIALPELSEILYCGCQFNEYYLWAKVDTSLPLTNKYIYWVGSGWEIPENKRLRFINTDFTHNYVWHFFELLG